MIELCQRGGDTKCTQIVLAENNLMNAKILKVTIFAISFAFIEAAVVIYLRHLLGAVTPTIDKNEILLLLPGIAFLPPQTAIKIITNSAILNVEMAREFATLVMLGSVAILAGRNRREYLAFFFLSFGIWDIFYYVFLRLTIGWPQTATDIDTFFLLPIPWVGPVFIPILISIFLVFGSLYFLRKKMNH